MASIALQCNLITWKKIRESVEERLICFNDEIAKPVDRRILWSRASIVNTFLWANNDTLGRDHFQNTIKNLNQ